MRIIEFYYMKNDMKKNVFFFIFNDGYKFNSNKKIHRN